MLVATLIFIIISQQAAITYHLSPFIINQTFFLLAAPLQVGTPSQTENFVFHDWGPNFIPSSIVNPNLINAKFNCQISTTCSMSTLLTDGLTNPLNIYSRYLTADIITPITGTTMPFSFYIPSTALVPYMPYSFESLGFITVNPSSLQSSNGFAYSLYQQNLIDSPVVIIDFRGVPLFGQDATKATANITFGTINLGPLTNNDIEKTYSATLGTAGDMYLPYMHTYANQVDIDPNRTMYYIDFSLAYPSMQLTMQPCHNLIATISNKNTVCDYSIDGSKLVVCKNVPTDYTAYPALTLEVGLDFNITIAPNEYVRFLNSTAAEFNFYCADGSDPIISLGTTILKKFITKMFMSTSGYPMLTIRHPAFVQPKINILWIILLIVIALISLGGIILVFLMC